MKYTAFKKLIVEIIPESTMSAGGIDTSAAQKNSLYAKGKVISGHLFKIEPADRATSQWPSDNIPDIKEGDTVLFSKSAPHLNGQLYFLDEIHVLAIAED